MNITSAVINDPRWTGSYSDPFIELTVDEPVYELGDTIFVPKILPHYRSIQCGPFYALEHEQGPGHWVTVSEGSGYDAGEWNKYGLLDQQLAPVTVRDPEEVHDLHMTVPRLRRLIRKQVGDNWTVIIDEQAGLLGSLKWRLELRVPVCYGGAVPGADTCVRTPVQTLVYQETHLSFCQKHLLVQQARMSAARANSR